MSLPEKVSVTATLSVIKTGPQHASAIASVKEVTCYVKAEQKLIGLPSLQGERGPMGPVGNAVWGGITGDINDQTDLGSMAQVDDAPSDGAEYVRKNGNWAVSSGGGGGGGGASWGAITGTLSNQTDLQNALNAKANTADLGDLAFDDSVDYSDVTNTPTLGNLASKDTVDYTTEVTNKPTLGTMSAVNDASSDNKTYGRKNGTWVEVTGGGGGSVDWGDIGGTLSDQTDLAEALLLKAYESDLANEFSTSQSYTAGTCVIYQHRLFMFVQNKAAGAWDDSVAWMMPMANILRYQLSGKQDTLTFDTAPTASSTNPVTSGGIKTALDAKQAKLTFDNNPTSGSSNPVKSSGIYSALSGKQATLTFDNSPTSGSSNPVKSSGVYTAIHGLTLHLSMSSTSTLGTISNSSIKTTMRVVNIVWGSPENVLSDVSWNTNTAGKLVLSGTLGGATTAQIDLVDFG